MRIYRFLFFTFFVCPLWLFGQDPQFGWVNTVGGNSPDYTLAVGTDASGNVYTMGTFQGTADMDPGPGVVTMTSQGTLDIFLVKYNTAGAFVWARQIGNNHPLNEGPRNMIVDPAGNLYITGSFHATLDFDPGPAVFNLTCTGSGYAAFLLKIDANGNFAWAKNIAQSEGGNIGYAVDVAASGNIYVTGTFNGLTDFDPGPGTLYVNAANRAQDIFISKFDNNGNFIWSKQFSGTQGQVSYAIKVDALENVYTTGLFYGTGDFDPGPAFHNLVANDVLGGWGDIFVSKLDADGNFVWVKQFSGERSETAYGLALDPFGNVIITGEFTSDTDFDPGPGVFILETPNWEIKGFLVKLDSNGQLIWAGQLGGPGAAVMARTVICDEAGNMYVSGSFRGPADFDPANTVYNLASQGSSVAVFLCKINADGTFGFAQQIAGGLSSHAYSMAIDKASNIFLSGFFSNPGDFDPGPGVHMVNLNGSVDGYVIKLTQCRYPSSQTLTINACGSYILNGQHYTSSGNYIQQLINTAGCDSTLTLNLTIGGSETTTEMIACSSYDWEGQTYTISGRYTVIYIDADGCDSIRNLDLVIRPIVKTVITLSLCEGQSYQGYDQPGTYTDVFMAANGCDSTRTLQLDILPASREIFNVSICEGESYWDHTTTGDYRDTLIAANGCDSIRVLHLQVNPVKRSVVNISICKGQSHFTAGADQYSSGIYIDTLLTALGCDSIISTHLTVHDLPVPDLGSDRDLCAGTTIALTPGSFASYEWQDQTTGAAFTVAGTGRYWVSVKDLHGCTATDSLVIDRLLPVPVNFLKQTDSICQYEKLKLLPEGQFNNYTWSDGSHGSSLTIEAPGRYTLQVQDGNGCWGSATTDVYSKICRTGVFIPTAFTPNGDGLNDLFRPVVYGTIVSFRLEVYNRWGQLIFYTTDAYRGWDGRSKGTDNNTAVFVWRCSYQLAGDVLIQEKGVVTLVR